jgi:hypothetical protein
MQLLEYELNGKIQGTFHIFMSFSSCIANNISPSENPIPQRVINTKIYYHHFRI